MSWWFTLPALAAGGYYAIALAAGIVRRIGRRKEANPSYLPPISILKPLRGRDPRFLEALRSHASQDYPEFELVFGVSDPADPALADIEILRREYPELRIVVVQSVTDAPNRKVGVLIDLALEARHPVLLVSDSDIRVDPGYLREVVGPLYRPETGVVTCLYRATAESLPARFEALGVSTEFAPSVLVAPLAGVSGFALGSTMVFRAADLERAGGFAALAGYLADDYHLGRILSGLGLRVHLSHTVVETCLSGSGWSEVWRHALRWSRTIRMSRPAGYYGYLATQATFWALLALIAGHPGVASAVMAVRLAAAWVVGSIVLKDPNAARLLWLIPLRDLWGFAIWLAGLFGDSVEWRGLRLRLTSRGRILPGS
ncbi:MAG: bacteriohopanetetrol glucosamine biosynthesis glycosyltransferase HpnI [Bryobacteraceae bacterium]